MISDNARGLIRGRFGLVIATMFCTVGLDAFQRPPEQPDLSATWTLIPLSDSPVDWGGAPEGRSFRIRQSPDSITLTTTKQYGGPRTAVYRTDGSAHVETVALSAKESRTQTTRVVWQGRVLVLTREWSLHRQVVTYSLASPTEIVVTRETSLLTDRNDRLVVSTVGPSTRSYRRSGSEQPPTSQAPNHQISKSPNHQIHPPPAPAC